MPSSGTRHSFRSLAVTSGSVAVPVVGVPLMTKGSMLSTPALVFWYRATIRSLRFWPCVPDWMVSDVAAWFQKRRPPTMPTPVPIRHSLALDITALKSSP